MSLNWKPLATAALTVAIVAGAGVRSASASEIVLRLKEGGFEIAGKLAAFDGQIYRIETEAYGTLDLEAARFDCTGGGCSPPGAVPAAPIAPLSRSTETPIGAEKPQRFAIHGSFSIGARLMPALIRGYAARLSADVTQVSGLDGRSVQYKLRGAGGTEIATIDLQRQDSTSAFRALASGAAVIGMADQRIPEPEYLALAVAVPKLRGNQHEHVLGLDGIAIIVAQERATTALKLETIAKIFAGEIKDWSELGLARAPINVMTLDQGTSTFSVFDNLVLKPRGLKMAQAARQLQDNGEIAEAVARDANAIGFTTMAFIEDAKSVDIETTCGLAVGPSAFALKTGEYPLAQELYLYTAAPIEQSMATGLLQYALSDAAQTSIATNQFVNQSFETAERGAQKARMTFAAKQPIAALDAVQMRRLFVETGRAHRLSATFRFAPASAQLDAKSRHDLLRLSQYLQTPELRTKTVMLLGFTDPIGNIPQNTALSLGRATQVRAALLAISGGSLAPQRIAAQGFGALAPIACSDSPRGLHLNRRVEVWVRD